MGDWCVVAGKVKKSSSNGDIAEGDSKESCSEGEMDGCREMERLGMEDRGELVVSGMEGTGTDWVACRDRGACTVVVMGWREEEERVLRSGGRMGSESGCRL